MGEVRQCTGCGDFRERRYAWKHQTDVEHYQGGGRWYCVDCAASLIPHHCGPREMWLLYEVGDDRPAATVGRVSISSIGVKPIRKVQ